MTPPVQNPPGSTAQSLVARDVEGVRAYIRSGSPYVWLTAAAISVAFIITLALLILTAARGLPPFWPADRVKARYAPVGDEPVTGLAEIRSSEEVTSGRLKNAGLKVDESQPLYERLLIKVANRDLLGADFRPVLSDWLVDRSYPEDAVVLERMEWGNFHGFLHEVKSAGAVVGTGAEAWNRYEPLQDRANELRHEIEEIEKRDIGAINYAASSSKARRRRRTLARSPGSRRSARPVTRITSSCASSSTRSARTSIATSW